MEEYGKDNATTSSKKFIVFLIARNFSWSIESEFAFDVFYVSRMDNGQTFSKFLVFRYIRVSFDMKIDILI